MPSRLRFFLLFLLITSTALAIAADFDVKDSKDHPLVSRMPNYFIGQYRDVQFDQFVFKMGPPGKQVNAPVEGHYFHINYRPGRELTTKPSPLQVVRNIQEAIRKIGGEVLVEDSWNGNSWRGTILRITKKDQTVWISVKASPSDYTLDIIEQQAMKQDIVADSSSWANELARTGKANISGIYFDTAKSSLKPESDIAIAELAKLLKGEPKLKAYIVGHTDTVGDLPSNLKLSQDRARAVVNALTMKHGIAPSRLIPFGAGPYAPIASNRDEEGRAKNRRVELVEAGE